MNTICVGHGPADLGTEKGAILRWKILIECRVISLVYFSFFTHSQTISNHTLLFFVTGSTYWFFHCPLVGEQMYIIQESSQLKKSDPNFSITFSVKPLGCIPFFFKATLCLVVWFLRKKFTSQQRTLDRGIHMSVLVWKVSIWTKSPRRRFWRFWAPLWRDTVSLARHKKNTSTKLGWAGLFS